MVLVRRVFIATLVLLALVLSILMAVLVFVGRGIPSALEPDGDANTSYVIRGAGVLSMDESTIHENWAVVVHDGVISALGPNDIAVAPDGVQVIDAQGKTLIPGLVDMHVHLYDETEKLNMPVFGHPVEGKPPANNPLAKAPFDLVLDDGLVDLEHMESIIWHALDQDMNDDRARVLAGKIAAAGVVVDPTLIVHRNLTEITKTRGAYIHRAETDMFNPLVLLFDQASLDFWASYEQDNEIQLAQFYQRCVKIFHEEGVILTVGTDSGAMTTLPGSSVTRELELFVRSGLSPLEALKSATVHPANALGLGEEIGQIRVGYKADMILVDGNPLIDVSVVEHPAGVMRGGAWLAQADLAQLHEAAGHPSLIRSLRHLVEHLLARM